jgi:hypothetical protein
MGPELGSHAKPHAEQPIDAPLVHPLQPYILNDSSSSQTLQRAEKTSALWHAQSPDAPPGATESHGVHMDAHGPQESVPGYDCDDEAVTPVLAQEARDGVTRPIHVLIANEHYLGAGFERVVPNCTYGSVPLYCQFLKDMGEAHTWAADAFW